MLIREEEWHPVYTFGNEGYQIKVTKEEEAIIREGFTKFCEAQELLEAKFKAKKGKYIHEKR